MSNLRRYEVLLPLKFNDGQPVPWSLIGDTLLELRQRFGAASFETQTILGIWRQDGTEYHDEMVRVFVDVEDRPEHRQYFRDYKAKLKSRFRQFEIWITTYPVESV